MEQPSRKEPKSCLICGKPATRMVDGEPSCETHAELVYENQVEDYTKKNAESERSLESALNQSAKRD